MAQEWVPPHTPGREELEGGPELGLTYFPAPHFQDQLGLEGWEAAPLPVTNPHPSVGTCPFCLLSSLLSVISQATLAAPQPGEAPPGFLGSQNTQSF